MHKGRATKECNGVGSICRPALAPPWVVAVLLAIWSVAGWAVAGSTRGESSPSGAEAGEAGPAGSGQAYKAGGVLELAPVDFLEARPVIDGLLDPSLRSLPRREFNIEEKSSPTNSTTRASYRIAYGTEFFYLYLETEGDSFAFRDRAFQYGDGFNLLMALVEGAESRSDEFFVLAGGAVDRPELDWTRSIFWVHNVDTLFKKTSEATEVSFRAHEGRLSFEVYLPWKEVYPYHPWISEGLGFNLRLNKAIGSGQERNQLTVLDDSIAKAGQDKVFIPLSFAEPKVVLPQAYAILERNNVTLGDPVGLKMATVAPEDTELVTYVETISEGGDSLSLARLRSSVPAGVKRQTLLIPESESTPIGSYELRWERHWGFDTGVVTRGVIRAGAVTNGATAAGDANPGDATAGYSNSRYSNSNISRFSVLDRFDRKALASRLEDLRGLLQLASYETILFLIDELEGDLAAMRSYDEGAGQITAMASLARILDGASEGTDVLAEARGLSRKAFQSRVDDTLQPYSVFVPENYDPARKYPLVVYLHGSDSSEMDLAGVEFVASDCCIGVGPFARGRTNFYLGEGPQTDIQEAIDAVASSYSVDTDRIVVVGFSMGGWGSYLTYHTRPDRFLGLAAFSGIPFIPGMDDSESVPDFRRDEFLGHLGGAQVFVSHGRQDNVGTIEVIDAFVEKLRSKGANVVYVVDDERGHSRPTQPEIERYQQWLLGLVDG